MVFGSGGFFLYSGSLQELEHVIQTCTVGISDWYSRNGRIECGGIEGLVSRGDRRVDELMIDDLIRRYNLVVQLTNSLIDPYSSYAEVYPKVVGSGSYRGGYCPDFDCPVRLESIYNMDATTLERVLNAYGIFSCDLGIGTSCTRDARGQVLLEYLGVNVANSSTSHSSPRFSLRWSDQRISLGLNSFPAPRSAPRDSSSCPSRLNIFPSGSRDPSGLPPRINFFPERGSRNGRDENGMQPRLNYFPERGERSDGDTSNLPPRYNHFPENGEEAR